MSDLPEENDSVVKNGYIYTGKRGRPKLADPEIAKARRRTYSNKQVRFLAELPRFIVAKIDDWCDDMRMTRNQFIREAVYERMRLYGIFDYVSQFHQPRVDSALREDNEPGEIDHGSWTTDEGVTGDDFDDQYEYPSADSEEPPTRL